MGENTYRQLLLPDSPILTPTRLPVPPSLAIASIFAGQSSASLITATGQYEFIYLLLE